MTNFFSGKNNPNKAGLFFSIKAIAVVALFFALTGVEASAQGFQNNNNNNDSLGRYFVGTNGGTIRVMGPTARFNGSAPLGQFEDDRIPGTVEFVTDDSTGMGVQTSLTGHLTESGWWYTNLVVKGTNAVNVGTANDTIYVSGSYTVEAGTGDRTYAGWFHYDGDDAQEIESETGAGGTNSYVNLWLSNGANAAKTISEGDSVVVDGTFLSEAANGLDITDGQFSLIDDTDGRITTALNLNGAGASFNVVGTSGLNIDSNSTTTLTQGEFRISSTGDSVSVWAGSTLDLAADAGELVLGADSELNILGSMVNNSTNSTNFDADIASNVYYSGDTQTIMPTNWTNPYGNLFLNSSVPANQAVVNDSVVVANDLAVNQEVDASAGYVVMVEKTSGDTNNITFTSGYEIEGYVEWRGLTDAGSFKRFNNQNTGMSFETAPNGGSGTPFVALNSVPTTIPTKADDIAANEDISRTYTISYIGDAQIDTISFAWEATDELGGWTSNSTMRIAEAWNASEPKQKITRQGATYSTDFVSAQRWVRYQADVSSATDPKGIELIAGGADNSASNADRNFDVATTSEIVLTNSAANMISVKPGRWTDPDTWDEGRRPVASDTVEIEHVVYTGIDNGPFTTDTETEDEWLGGNPQHWAAKIYVNDVSNAALLVGNQDADMGTGTEAKFGTEYVDNSGIVNNNANANSWSGNLSDATGLNGVYVMESRQFIPVLSVRTLLNAGDVTNESIIEVGE